MKRIVMAMLSIVFFNFCLSQKNNYNKSYYFNEYIDKIVDCRNYISSKSKYLFYGEIKSVYVEVLDANGDFSGEQTKTYYGKDKQTIKRTIFDTPDKFVTTEYFDFYNTSQYSVIKKCVSSYYGEITLVASSEIDTNLNLIITSKFLNNKVHEIDSIFYIADFLPIEIITVSPGFIDRSIRKFAYLENGLVYKEAYQRNNTNLGYFSRFDENHNIEYQYDITLLEFDKVGQDYFDSLKTKIFTLKWFSKTDFEIFVKNTHTLQFSLNERKMTKVDNYSISTTHFNQDLLPIRTVIHDKKDDYITVTIYSYNKNSDLISMKSNLDELILGNYTYAYVYDSMNNWVERKQYENGKLLFTTKRSIEYY